MVYNKTLTHIIQSVTSIHACVGKHYAKRSFNLSTSHKTAIQMGILQVVVLRLKWSHNC
jgi:branched-subunit amino acid transport protein AzlD